MPVRVARRVMLLRTHTGLSQGVVERTAQILEHLAALHTVQLLLRQHVNDPSQLLLTCFNAHNAERTLKSLKEEGFKQGPSPSGEVKLREGQMLELGFRGNIQPMESSFVRRCVFHSNIPFRVQFSVTEIDRFAQKGFSSYRGFVQLSTTYSVPFRRMGRALEQGEIGLAASRMAIIRRLIGINLILGLITTVIGSGRFF